MSTREQQAEMLKLTAATLPEEKAKKLLEDGKKTFIHEDVRKEHDVNDELALHRKEIARLYEIIALLHPGEIDNAEFTEYNASVERFKTDAKDKLGI